MAAAANVGWGGRGHRGEVVPSRVFSSFFGSFKASTAYPEKRGFSLSAPENVVRWWFQFSSVTPGFTWY